MAQAFFEGLRASPDSLAPFLFMLNLLGNKAAGEGSACGLSCTRSIWATAGLASLAWRVAARVWLFDGAARLAFRLENDGQRRIFATWALGGSLWESSSGDAKRAYRLNVLLRLAIGGQQRESPVRSWSGQTR